MHLELKQTDKENITKSILEKYAKASVAMEGSFRYPTGAPALKKLGYEEVRLRYKTGFNSSGKTEGVLISAKKP